MKSLLTLCFEYIVDMTIRHSQSGYLYPCEATMEYLVDIWKCINVLFINKLWKVNKYLGSKLRDIMKGNLEHAFTVLAISQNTCVILSGKFYSNTMFVEIPVVRDYFDKILMELDVTGCGNIEIMLLKVLPLCRTLSKLTLGMNGTLRVLEAARSCPLNTLHSLVTFVKFEEKYLFRIFFGLDISKYGSYIDLCNRLKLNVCQTTKEHPDEPVLLEWKSMVSSMRASWPKMKELFLGRYFMSGTSGVVVSDIFEFTLLVLKNELHDKAFLHTLSWQTLSHLAAVKSVYDSSSSPLKSICSLHVFSQQAEIFVSSLGETLDIMPNLQCLSVSINHEDQCEALCPVFTQYSGRLVTELLFQCDDRIRENYIRCFKNKDLLEIHGSLKYFIKVLDLYHAVNKVSLTVLLTIGYCESGMFPCLRNDCSYFPGTDDRNFIIDSYNAKYEWSQNNVESVRNELGKLVNPVVTPNILSSLEQLDITRLRCLNLITYCHIPSSGEYISSDLILLSDVRDILQKRSLHFSVHYENDEAIATERVVVTAQQSE